MSGRSRSGQRLGRHHAARIHRQPIDAEAGCGQLAERLGDGRMLDGAGEEVAGRVAGQAEEGEVVRLGGAAGEDHLIGMGAEQGGDPLAGVFQGLAGAAAGAVALAGLPYDVGQERPHRLPDGRQQRRGGIVVEVDADP